MNKKWLKPTETQIPRDLTSRRICQGRYNCNIPCHSRISLNDKRLERKQLIHISLFMTCKSCYWYRICLCCFCTISPLCFYNISVSEVVVLDAPSHLYKSLCPSVGPYVPCYFRRWKKSHTRRIFCRVSDLVFLTAIFLPDRNRLTAGEKWGKWEKNGEKWVKLNDLKKD